MQKNQRQEVQKMREPVKCPMCGKNTGYRDELDDSIVRCSNCNEQFIVEFNKDDVERLANRG